MFHKYIKRKERIIIDAIDILDEQGIQGLTTKEIARREGITEPAIYRQFDSKKDIILAIMDRFASYDELIINTILEQQMSFCDAILYYCESYTTYYQNYPQITTVLFSFDVFKYEPETYQKMQNIVNHHQNSLSMLVRKGIESGELDPKTDSDELAEIILGVVWSKIWRWKINKCDYDLKESVIGTMKWVIGNRAPRLD